MNLGELLLTVCLAGMAASLSTMAILAKREMENRPRRMVPPVTDESIRAAQLAAAFERARFEQVTGHPITAAGRVIH